MKRVWQAILMFSTLGLSWLGMQAAHELGHVLAARATGGTIVRIVLYPTTISRTEVFPNPHPLIEVWAGPIFGSILPLLAYLIIAATRCPEAYLFRFFAGFCLVANGAYLLAGAMERMGDPGKLLRHGAHLWQLIAFGFIATLLGFVLWNDLGPRFGLGVQPDQVGHTPAMALLFLLIAACAAEVVLGHA